MNSRPLDEETIVTETFSAFAKAETQVTSWPTNDLFADFGGPTLGTSAQSIIFNSVTGATAPDVQSLQVTAAPSPVNFTVTIAPAASWLTVNRLAGTTPATLNLAVSPTGLRPGTYQTVVTISAPQSSNASRAIPVTFNLTSVPGFTAIRNGASLMTATSAAAASRVVVDAAADLGADTVVKVTGSDSAELTATVVAASSSRIDFAVPADVPLGDATLTLTTGTGKVLSDRLLISPVSPGLFSASGDGTGAA